MWPAAAISAASVGARSTCSPVRKKVAGAPKRSSTSSTAGVPCGWGPSSKVRATPSPSSRRGMPSTRETAGMRGASPGRLQAAAAPAASKLARMRGCSQ